MSNHYEILIARNIYVLEEKFVEEKIYHSYEDTIRIAPWVATKEILEKYTAELVSKYCKLFIDFERNFKEGEEKETKEYHSLIKNLLLEKHTSFRNPFVFTESIQPLKVSFHIIFQKQKIEKETFLPEYEDELFTDIFGEHKKYFDVDVYKKNKYFRLPYGITPPKKIYPHVPVGEFELRDFFLSLPDETEITYYPEALNKQFKLLCKEEEDTSETIVENINPLKKEKVEKMITLLSPSRFKDTKNWFLLCNIMKSFDLKRDLFIDISEKSGYSKFNRKDCMNAWKSNKGDWNSYALLYKWLKEDGISTEDFVETDKNLYDLIRLVSKSELTDLRLSEYLYKKLKDDLYYTEKEWIFWKDNRWITGDNKCVMIPLMKLLTDDLVEYYRKKLKKVKEQKEEDEEDEDKEEIKKTKNIVLGLQIAISSVLDLQKVKNMKNVIECSKGLFYNENILKKFNTKPELFSFDNNITYNLKTKETYPTKREDYILYTCGYDFPERDQNDIDLVNEDIFNSLFEKENINYSKSLLSSLVYGENINEHYIVHQGIGRNGKGLMDNLLQTVLCNYYIPFSPEQFTEYQKDKNRANSELAQSIGKRCVMTTEPESGSTIKTENLKRLTGRDPITTRELHGKTVCFKNTFTVNIQANDLPKLSKLDEAIEKRMKILHYPFQFVHQDKKVRDYQRIIDVELKDKVRNDTRYRNGLLWILFDTWAENGGMVITNQQADELKQEEMNKSNPLSEFLDKYEESDKFMLISDLYKSHKALGYDMKLKDFKQYLSLSGYEMKIDKSNGDKIKIKMKQ